MLAQQCILFSCQLSSLLGAQKVRFASGLVHMPSVSLASWVCLAGYRSHQIHTLAISLCMTLHELSAAWPLSRAWDVWSCYVEEVHI